MAGYLLRPGLAHTSSLGTGRRALMLAYLILRRKKKANGMFALGGRYPVRLVRGHCSTGTGRRTRSTMDTAMALSCCHRYVAHIHACGRWWWCGGGTECTHRGGCCARARGPGCTHRPRGVHETRGFVEVLKTTLSVVLIGSKINQVHQRSQQHQPQQS